MMNKEEFKKILQEAYYSGYKDAEEDINIYTEARKVFRKRLPNHPSKIDPNNPNAGNDLHQKAPIMRKKLKKLKL